MRQLRFLHAVGCAAVAGGGCASVICLVLAIAVWAAALRPGGGLRVAGVESMPEYLRPLYDDPRLITTLTLAGSVVVLLTGIGILQRREWGRRLALAVSCAGIAWVVFAIPAMWQMSAMRAAAAPSGSLFARSALAFQILNSMVAAGVLVLLVWLLHVLRRPDVRAQFSE